MRRRWGLRAPRPRGKGFHPLHPNKRKNELGRENKFRLPRWGLRKLGASGPRKPGKSPMGKVYFPLVIIPRLSPDALHPGWRLRRRARSTTALSLTSSFLHAAAGTKFVFHIKQHPLLRVQGGHRPGGDEPQTTACSGNLVCGEISRNEQSPQELRRLRLRKGQSPAVLFLIPPSDTAPRPWPARTRAV